MSVFTISRNVTKGLRSCNSLTSQVCARRLSQSKPSRRCIHIFTSARPTARKYKSSKSLIPQSTKRSLFIQTEGTPNPDALKFRPNQRVLPDDFASPFIEYLNPRSTLAAPNPSPLASSLFNVEGVTSVFFGADYITVTKDSGTQWAHVKPEVFSLISESVTSGKPMIKTVESTSEDGENGATMKDSLAYDPDDSDVVSDIKELLETRIRPSIQEDGGDIDFRGFENGYVYLKLRGACRTCDSSTVTLRNGIESMLMHYIEEVKGVEQVLDEEEEVALREFQKFEERLKQQQGHVTPSTTAKGSIDTIE